MKCTMYDIKFFKKCFLVPGRPKDLRTIQVDKNTVELSWSPPDEPNGELIEYRIVYFGYKQGENEALKVCSSP